MRSLSVLSWSRFLTQWLAMYLFLKISAYHVFVSPTVSHDLSLGLCLFLGASSFSACFSLFFYFPLDLSLAMSFFLRACHPCRGVFLRLTSSLSSLCLSLCPYVFPSASACHYYFVVHVSSCLPLFPSFSAPSLPPPPQELGRSGGRGSQAHPGPLSGDEDS